MGREDWISQQPGRRPRGVVRRVILVCTIAWALVIPTAAFGLVAPTPTPSDGPDHPIGPIGRVNDIAVVGGIAYLGGDFSSVGGQPRANLAAIDIGTGLVTPWNPGANGVVNEIEPSPDGSAVYVGGAFTTIDGQNRGRVAEVTTAGVVTEWNPNASAEVRDLAVGNDLIIIGGAFGSIGGTGVSFLAAADPTTGGVDPTWDPSPQSSVSAVDLTADGATVYLGGDFDLVGGASRPHVAAVDVATGTVTPWVTTTPHRVIDIDTAGNGSVVYLAVGGPFADGGNLAAAYSAAAGGDPIWSRQTDGDVQAVAVGPDAVYWGGHFVWSQGTYLNALMALDPTTGGLIEWAPGANSGFGVWSLTYAANRLFVGGDFTITGGATQPHFAVYEETGPVGPTPPVASFTWSCSLLDCDFDASESFDLDGPIVTYDWDFGDGASDSGITATRPYSRPGTYEVTLTVTDSGAATDTVTHPVTVTDDPGGTGIDFVAVSAAADNTASIDVTIPVVATTGDALLLFATANGNDMEIDAPLGWTPIDSLTSSTMTTSVWYRVAVPGDAGSTVTVAMTDIQKIDVALAVYSGTNHGDPIVAAAGASESVVRADHTTPTVTSPADGARVVGYWANKTSGATQWTPPAGEVVRHEGYGTGGGRITALLTDGGTDVPAGTHGGVTAISDDDGAKATMWTIALAPAAAAPNQPPAASFTVDCTDLTCSADATTSSDPDGTIVAYDWDFGDDTTTSGTTTTHTYPTAGTYTIALTVTDDNGATDTTATNVTTTDPPAVTPVAFRGFTAAEDNTPSLTVAIPAAAQEGDALLLLVTVNNSAEAVTVPAGWNEIGAETDQSMQTRIYLRVAQPGDAGADVVVDLGSRKKMSVIVAAYAGTDTTNPIAALVSTGESGNTAEHVTPEVGVPVDGAWAISYWADKTSSTTSWTAPAGVVERYQAAMAGGGRIAVLLADAGPIAPGSYGGLVAMADSSGGKATMWSIVLAPGS